MLFYNQGFFFEAIWKDCSGEWGTTACHSYHGKFEAGSGSVWGDWGTKTISMIWLIVLLDVSWKHADYEETIYLTQNSIFFPLFLFPSTFSCPLGSSTESLKPGFCWFSVSTGYRWLPGCWWPQTPRTADPPFGCWPSITTQPTEGITERYSWSDQHF